MPRSPKNNNNKNVYEALSSKKVAPSGTPTRPPASRSTIKTPTRISRSENSSLVANTSPPSSSSSSSSKPGIVTDAINAIFENSSKWTRDESISMPGVVPEDVKIPSVTFKTNTHRGNNFTVMEGRPIKAGDYLWLQAEIPRNGKADASLTNFTAAILQYMTQCMRARLEKISARKVNAKIFMRKPTATHVTVVCVVGFRIPPSPKTAPSTTPVSTTTTATSS